MTTISQESSYPVLAPREVYETKARRWQEQWPELTVLPRPSD
ncbi:nucleotidyltransferase family protein [Halopolyspora algeriensis]|nr:nucleotidyltransferase family protein [Halopolyspora algeriensis]